MKIAHTLMQLQTFFLIHGVLCNVRLVSNVNQRKVVFDNFDWSSVNLLGSERSYIQVEQRSRQVNFNVTNFNEIKEEDITFTFSLDSRRWLNRLYLDSFSSVKREELRANGVEKDDPRSIDILARPIFANIQFTSREGEIITLGNILDVDFKESIWTMEPINGLAYGHGFGPEMSTFGKGSILKKSRVTLTNSEYYQLTQFRPQRESLGFRPLYVFDSPIAANEFEIFKSVVISSLQLTDLRKKNPLSNEAAAILRQGLLLGYSGETNFAFLPAILAHMLYSTENPFGHTQEVRARSNRYEGRGLIQLTTQENFRKMQAYNEPFIGLRALNVYNHPEILDEFNIFTVAAQVNFLIRLTEDNKCKSLKDFLELTRPAGYVNNNFPNTYYEYFYNAREKVSIALEAARVYLGLPRPSRRANV